MTPEVEETTSEIDNPELDLSPEDILAIATALKEKQRKDKEELDDLLEGLAQELESKFLDRVSRRTVKDRQMLRCLQLYYGSAVASYGNIPNQDRPFPEETAKRSPQHNIVRTKLMIAIAQAITQQFAGGEKNWDINAAKVPKDANGQPVDPKIAQAASDKLEAIIEDQLTQCKYGTTSRQSILDKHILGTAAVKGPKNVLVHSKRYRNMQTGDGKTISKAVLETKKAPSVVYVNPWFWYPDDTVLNVDDCEDSIELHPMSKAKLLALANSEESGFYGFRDNIFEVIKTVPDEYRVNQRFHSFTSLGSGNTAFKHKYLCLEYHGPIEKPLLDKLNINPTYENPEEIYFGEIWVVGGKVIRVELSTIDGCFSIPYACDTWEKDPGHIFGLGAPLFVGDQQDVINTTFKMLLDNAAISSGPQVVMNREMIEPATPGDWRLQPDKIWNYTSFADGEVKKAIDFFTPPNVTNELSSIIMMAKGFGEEEFGTPLLAAGLSSPQVQDTATNAQIVQQSATIVSDLKNESWDDNITKKVITWMHDWNIEYSDDPSIKMDFEIDVRTSSEYKNKLIQVKDLEKLSVEASQNPALGDWINQDALQKARLSIMTLPNNNIVRTQEEYEEAMSKKGPDPQQIENQLKQQELQIKNQELQIKVQELQTKQAEMQLKAQEMQLNNARAASDIQINQQMALWDHQEKMGAVYARIQESQSQVIAAELARQTELLKLAQKDSVDKAAIMADLQKENIKDSREKFLAGVDHANEMRKYLLQEQEIKLAKKNGQGALSTV